MSNLHLVLSITQLAYQKILLKDFVCAWQEQKLEDQKLKSAKKTGMGGVKSMSKAQGLMKVREICTVTTSLVAVHLVGFEATLEESVIGQ